MTLAKDISEYVLPKNIATINDEYANFVLDSFANQVDRTIQDVLISELTSRYAELSREIEDKSKKLEEYNTQLHTLVDDKVKEISDSQIATIHALVKAAEARDDETGAHIERTSQYCKLLALKLKQDPRFSFAIDDTFPDVIAAASPLHDIGKIGIRDDILLKPGKLTPEEFEIMKTHVIIGYNTLASVDARYHNNAFIQMGMDIARYHHEWWNGAGYMSGLKGEAIPLSARIMALSDVYDALRGKRVYKPPFSHNKAIAIIQEGRETHFDPYMTDIFLDSHMEFCEIFDRLTTDE